MSGYSNSCSQFFSTYNIASPKNGYFKSTQSRNTDRGIRTASRSAGTKLLVHCKDASQGMYYYIIILIVSVSNNLSMVIIKFISLRCVCQSCYVAGSPTTTSRLLGSQIKIEVITGIINGLPQILGEAYTTTNFDVMISVMAYNIE